MRTAPCGCETRLVPPSRMQLFADLQWSDLDTGAASATPTLHPPTKVTIAAAEAPVTTAAPPNFAGAHAPGLPPTTTASPSATSAATVIPVALPLIALAAAVMLAAGGTPIL